MNAYSLVIARLDRATQYSRVLVWRHCISSAACRLLGRPVKPGDDSCVCVCNIAPPSGKRHRCPQILHVSGSFRGPRSRSEEREAERRKTHLGRGRGLFPGSPGNRGHGNAFRRSVTAVSVPGTVLPSAGRLSRRFPRPSPVSSSH